MERFSVKSHTWKQNLQGRSQHLCGQLQNLRSQLQNLWARLHKNLKNLQGHAIAKLMSPVAQKIMGSV